ncbi:MAG: hypothetical protein ABFS12_01930 [Bacteroidota bacterium]
MRKIFFSFLSSIILISFLFIGCSEKKVTDPPTSDEDLAKVNSCEGCHTNYEHLKANHTPEDPPEDTGGCGGAPPFHQPYDRVYLGGAGYDAFKNDIHGKLGCVTCHNGVEGTSDRTVAHSNNFIKEPSHSSDEKCASCHPDIVARTKNSIHEQGWGQKMSPINRGGFGTEPEDFSKCPEDMKEGYSKNCFTCHATCGECHIIRPKIDGGGLINGHAFAKKPSMINVCAKCHVSRGWHGYAGIASGTKPDVHFTKQGYTCMSCHTKDEIHGDGNIYKTRYAMPQLPKCENCHSGLETSNIYHEKHFNKFNCQACHSQDYNNCGSCHISGDDGHLSKVAGGAGARVPSHQKFKIAMNPLKTAPYSVDFNGRDEYKLATVRQALSAPDSWDNWGVATLANFDVFPTYKYTTPHNILRWTARTDTTVSDSGTAISHPACAQACHIVKMDDGSLRNREFYLFNSNPEDEIQPSLNDWEVNANINIVVDDKLPARWEAK